MFFKRIFEFKELFFNYIGIVFYIIDGIYVDSVRFLVEKNSM